LHESFVSASAKLKILCNIVSCSARIATTWSSLKTLIKTSALVLWGAGVVASAPVTASVAFYGLAIAATIRVLRVPGGPAQLETRDREEAAYVQHAREEGIL
jgi:hypothetical protein